MSDNSDSAIGGDNLILENPIFRMVLIPKDAATKKLVEVTVENEQARVIVKTSMNMIIIGAVANLLALFSTQDKTKFMNALGRQMQVLREYQESCEQILRELKEEK